MEQGQFDVFRFDGADEHYLCVLQRPSRRSQSTVLVAVRIANHDGLLIVAALEVLPVLRSSEQIFENLAAAVEVIDRF